MSEEGLRFRPRVAVVDANVALGHGHDQPSPAADAPALLATLDRHGVERAVVHYAYAQTRAQSRAMRCCSRRLRGRRRG